MEEAKKLLDNSGIQALAGYKYEQTRVVINKVSLRSFKWQFNNLSKKKGGDWLPLSTK